MTRYYEDLTVGNQRNLGSVTADREEMIAFADRYDPQPFHVDPVAAEESHFGGLVASGWYTAALCMRRLVEEELSESAAKGALGIKELRWPAPVRPTDELLVTTTVADKRLSTSRPDAGIVTSDLTARRPDDQTVLEWRATVLWGRRTDS